MSEAPYMQLYVGDYLGDTRHLTTEQHGAYLLLLMAMWTAGGRLPNEPAKLCRITGVHPRRWHIVGPDVTAFFTVDGGHITQKRLVRERMKIDATSQSRAESGRLGGLSKAQKRASDNAGTEAQKRAPVIPPNVLKSNEPVLSIATILPQQKASIYHIPEPEEEKKDDAIASSKEKSPTKGTRLREGWEPSFDAFEFGAEEGLTTAEVTYQFQKFRDYWKGKAGSKAVKADWDSTLRNWLRTAGEEKRNRSPPRNGKAPETAWQRQRRAFEELDDERPNPTSPERPFPSLPKPGTH